MLCLINTTFGQSSLWSRCISHLHEHDVDCKMPLYSSQVFIKFFPNFAVLFSRNNRGKLGNFFLSPFLFSFSLGNESFKLITKMEKPIGVKHVLLIYSFLRTAFCNLQFVERSLRIILFVRMLQFIYILCRQKKILFPVAKKEKKYKPSNSPTPAPLGNLW